MDALKNFASGNKSENTANTQQSGEKKDYGDKSKLSYLPLCLCSVELAF